jgi:hypothetical protein
MREKTDASQLAIQLTEQELQLLLRTIGTSMFQGIEVPVVYAILSKFQNYLRALEVE